MPVIAKKLTWDDIKDLPEDAGRTEIVDGELVMASPPSDRHQEIATALGAKIYPFVKTRGLGKFYSSPPRAVPIPGSHTPVCCHRHGRVPVL